MAFYSRLASSVYLTENVADAAGNCPQSGQSQAGIRSKFKIRYRIRRAGILLIISKTDLGMAHGKICERGQKKGKNNKSFHTNIGVISQKAKALRLTKMELTQKNLHASLILSDRILNSGSFALN
jgi:hypothetical protein